jgi:hypothetical protein
MQRLLVFDPNDVYKLFVHYTDGALPLSGEVKQVGVSKTLQRMLIFMVESKEWREEDVASPFVVNFEGRRTATFDEKGQPVRHGEMNENPRRQ